MCRYKGQEEHPCLLTLAKAEKEEHRNGKDGKGRRKGPLGPSLGKTKNIVMETGGEQHVRSGQSRQHVHYP